MIDDIKDLSFAEREKVLGRRRFFGYFARCLPGIFVVSVITSLFAIFMLSDFVAAFTSERATYTSGRLVTNILFMFLLMVGIYCFDPKNRKNVRNFWITIFVYTITYLLSIFSSSFFENSYYAMPIALAALVCFELIDARVSILTSAVLGVTIISSYIFSLPFAEYNITVVVASTICNCMGAVLLSAFARKHYTRLKFLLVSILVPLTVQPFVLFTTLATGDKSINLLYNVLWSYGSNFAAALLFMPLVAIFEGIFNIADDFRLNELCNLSNPLLKRLASEAPGTFNHSLVVGNLAEACASAIGENPNLARCAAYYHDIGKLKAPLYFSENQSTYNPHDELIPEVSVSMITSHTLFGEILAKQNRLPSEIVDICRQHHGTAPVGYFYRKAMTLKEDGDLAVDKYTYAGPKPQTKIAAIIMIADTTEAAIRSYMPDSTEEYEARISMLVDEKVKLKQFDECPITFGDLAIIKRTIMDSLASVYHGRIDYDKKKRAAK